MDQRPTQIKRTSGTERIPSRSSVDRIAMDAWNINNLWCNSRSSDHENAHDHDYQTTHCVMAFEGVASRFSPYRLASSILRALHVLRVLWNLVTILPAGKARNTTLRNAMNISATSRTNPTAPRAGTASNCFTLAHLKLIDVFWG